MIDLEYRSQGRGSIRAGAEGHAEGLDVAAAVRLVILSDLHLVPPGEPLYGLDPAAHLARAVELIGRDHADADFLVLLGDLTHAGQAAAYAALAETLAPLSMPFISLTGNHDSRELLRAALPGTDRDPDGFVQALRVLPEASLLTLDTLDEGGGSAAGTLCPARLAFLERSLAEAPADRPLLLFQHHPPFATGLRGMDRIRLDNAEEEWAVIARTRRPDYLFLGHVHRPVFGLWRGIPFHIQRGLAHQIALRLGGSDENRGTHEGCDYAVVDVGPDGIVIHHRPVLYDGPDFALRDEAARWARRLV